MKALKIIVLIFGIIFTFLGLIAMLAGDVAIAAVLLVIGIPMILIGKPKKADPSVKVGPSSGIDPEKRTMPEPARPVHEKEPEEWNEPEVEEEIVDLDPVEDVPEQHETVREVYVQQEATEPVGKKKPWWENLPKSEAQIRKERIAENRRAGIACCPKCGSTSLSANKKGYSFVKGVLIGPLGGTIGMNKLKVTCLNCGNIFKPGQE